MDIETVKSSLSQFSLRSLSQESGLSRQSIKAIRDGQTENPGITTIAKLKSAVRALRKRKSRRNAEKKQSPSRDNQDRAGKGEAA